MCMVVYIGTQMVVRTWKWDKNDPRFHVVELEKRERKVRKQFKLGNVYYVGSHEGCGCGFQCGEYPEYDEERETKRMSLKELADFLRNLLIKTDTIELYSCWEGDQGKKPQHERVLTPDQIDSEDFFFLEKEKSVIISDAV